MSDKKKPTRYTTEFRQSAVKLAVESDQPISQTAKELGINENTLHTWIGSTIRRLKPILLLQGVSLSMMS